MGFFLNDGNMMTAPANPETVRRKPLVLGNWKMNGDVASAEQLLLDLLRGERELPASLAGVEAGVCPPFPYIGLAAARLAVSQFGWGAQNVAHFDNGAYTGEVSATMLRDLACTWVLIGHSERRAFFAETDAQLARKVEFAHRAGLVPVICVGESLAEREALKTESVIAAQINGLCAALASTNERFVIAYEPVWAIGTGLTASPEQAQQVHAFIRSRLAAGRVPGAAGARIIYGGSVKPSNAQALFGQPDVDGGLIGGASLVAEDFLSICRAAALRSVCQEVF
jgi:triosephosphate isomerase